MDIVVWSYLTYLVVSIGVTICVARTLVKRGRIFLVEAFGNEGLADSVNHLLVVGFYLINVGYVTLALRYGDRPTTVADAIEILSTKIGMVLLVLGLMHFINLAVFASMRRGAIDRRARLAFAQNATIEALQNTGGFTGGRP